MSKLERELQQSLDAVNAVAHLGQIGSAEWLEARRKTLGASEVATALGLVPDSDVFSRPIDVWLEKTGAERVTPISRARTTAGNRLEPVVRDWYKELAGAALEQPNTLRHPEHDWVSCTPDSLALDSAGKVVRNVQVKVVGARASFAWPGQSSIDEETGSLILNPPDGIPQYYRVQVEWEMGILNALYGVEETHLVTLLGGTDLRIYEIDRDQELWSALFDSARKFWFDHVIADVPPPPDGSEAFKKYLTRRYPQVERIELDPMTEQIEEVARRYLRARDLEKRAGDAKDLAANELRSLIGDGSGYRGMGLRAAWRQTKTGRTLDVRET
jgi:predicted phage-related endonuclease